MRRKSWTVIVAGAVSLFLLGVPAGAQENTNPEIEPKAMAVLQRMAKALAEAQSLSVNLDIGFDVVQDSGLKIEFGETRAKKRSIKHLIRGRFDKTCGRGISSW